MSILFVIEFRGRNVTLERLEEMVRDERWVVGIRPEMPCRAPKSIGQVIPPGAVVSCKTTSKACAFMQSRSPSQFSTSFSSNSQRRQLAEQVFSVILRADDSWLIWAEGPEMESHGPEFVRELTRNPNWYWGCGDQPPGLPFRQIMPRETNQT